MHNFIKNQSFYVAIKFIVFVWRMSEYSAAVHNKNSNSIYHVIESKGEKYRNLTLTVTAKKIITESVKLKASEEDKEAQNKVWVFFILLILSSMHI